MSKARAEAVQGRATAAPETSTSTLGAISWRNERRRLADLVPWPYNPRTLSEKQASDIAESLRRWGLAEPLVINADGVLIGGHQRRNVLSRLLAVLPDVEVDVRVPERQLEDDEMAELNVRLNKNTGSWDFDALSNYFDEDALKEWGFTDFDMGKIVPDDETNPRKHGDKKPAPFELQYRVMIECASEDEQRELLERLEGEGLKCRPLIL